MNVGVESWIYKKECDISSATGHGILELLTFTGASQDLTSHSTHVTIIIHLEWSNACQTLLTAYT
jgi:hypothetical protein